MFCPRGSPLLRRKLLARCQPWGEALGSIQTSCSAPTGDVGCCPGGCGTGSVKGSARAVLIVLRIRSMAARPASLFGREKAGTGAMRVSRSHARLETRTRAQAVNARGRREGKGGWGWLGLDSEGTQRGSQADRHAGPCPYQLCRGTEFSAVFLNHQQHSDLSLHCHLSSAGGEVLS